MADISKITLPNGNIYNIKDSVARSAIDSIMGGDAITFGGVTTSALADGGTQKPTVNNEQVDPIKGQLYFYGTKEYLWDGAKWIELGNLDALGNLAYKDIVSYDKTTGAQLHDTPTFTGDAVHLVTTIPTIDDFTSEFVGDAGTISVTGTPTGTVSAPSFTGTGVRLVTSSINIPTSADFSGNELTLTGSTTPTGNVTVTTDSTVNKTAVVAAEANGTATYTPGGTVGTPTISVKTAGATTTVKNPTSTTVAKTVVAAAPTETAPSNSLVYYSVNNENLTLYQLGYTTGDSITTTDVTVKTNDAEYESTQPSFTGTGVRLVTGNIAVPNTYSATFTGSADTISLSGTPTGSIGLNTTATTATVGTTTGTATYTPGGTIGTPTFTGDSLTSTGSFTPEGSVTTDGSTTSTQYDVTVEATGTATYTPSGTVSKPTIDLTHTSTNGVAGNN